MINKLRNKEIKQPIRLGLIILLPLLLAAVCTIRPPIDPDNAQPIVIRGILDDIVEDYLIVTPFVTLTPTPTLTPTLTPAGGPGAGNGQDDPDMLGRADGNNDDFDNGPGSGGTSTVVGPSPSATVGPSLTPLPTLTASPTILPTLTATPTSIPTPTPPSNNDDDDDDDDDGDGGSDSPPAPTNTPIPTNTPTLTPTPLPPSVFFSKSVYSGTEITGTVTGTVPIQVNLSTATSQVVTVVYSTSNGSTLGWAFVPYDYLTAGGTLTFNPGETSKTFEVIIVNDANDDSDSETVSLGLSSPSNATLGLSAATLNIIDNDLPPTIYFDNLPYSTMESISPVLTVTLSHSSGKLVSFTYGPHDGTATFADGDYAALYPSINFGPKAATGESLTQTVVTWAGLINNDPGVPPDAITETIIMEIFTATNLLIGSPYTATLTVIDD